MRDPSCEMLFLLFSRRDVPYDLESVKRWDQINAQLKRVERKFVQ